MQVIYIAKMGAESILSDATGAIASVAENQTREYVTDFGRRKGAELEFNILGQNVALGPEAFGEAAGKLAGGVVEAILDKGVGAVASRGAAISNIVERQRVGPHTIGEYRDVGGPPPSSTGRALGQS